MPRYAIVALVLAGLAVSLPAADLEKSMTGQWLGAWVVTTTEAYSDCAGLFTNNRVNGRLVASSGAYRFQEGEIAKVKKVDQKRSRLDVHLELQETLLIPYQEGPFTLYREAYCGVEMEVVLPRDTVKKKDLRQIDSTIASLVQRYATETEARGSRIYNGRERDPYPPNYEQTVAEHARWKVAVHNELVQERIDTALRETSRLADRIDTDADYLAGFSMGVQTARSVGWSNDCGQLLAVRLTSVPAPVTARASLRPADAEGKYDEGHHDGRLLIQGLELLQRLPGCFLPEPPPFVPVPARSSLP